MEQLLQNPKISFIVISHNFEKYISDCLNSVKNQIYKNIEIIIVDDYSSDNTVSCIKDFISENSYMRVKFIRNQKNIGQLASFLAGLKEASGEFICQIDGDDVLFKDYAFVHLEAHLKTNVAMTSCQHINIDGSNTVHSFVSTECHSKKENKFDILYEIDKTPISSFAAEQEREDSDVKVLSNNKYSFATWHWAPTSSAMMRKSACDLLLNIKDPKKIKITADKFMFSFLHLIGSSALIYKPLYAYRKHTTNYSLANPVMGSRRYLRPGTQKNYIRNNKLIRFEMLRFILANYGVFSEKLNKANVKWLINRIIFSFDFATLKGFIKSLFI